MELNLNNPYAAPSADLSQQMNDGQTYAPSMFAMRGRIGRLRYLAYSIVLTILMLAVGGVLMGVLSTMVASVDVLAVLIYIPSIVVSLMMAVRRLNDMNQTGWLSVLILVPLINFFFGLWLLFAPGTAGSNRYGPAPSPNTTGVKILAWGGLIFGAALVVIIAAVAVPAYVKYKEKAAAALEQIEKAKQAPGQ